MLCALIMAGGSGQRFWPLSTEERPKQLLKLFSDKSMIRETVDRILPIISKDRIFIATNKKQAKGIREELPMISSDNIIVEPAFKDTAAAIGYGALYIKERFKDACMVVLASDHLIKDEKNFRSIILKASDAAMTKECIVTLGIKPSHPETGYGYIYIETDSNIELEQIYPVQKFLEKPNIEKAKTYIAAGNFLWNSGMFIFKAQTILEEIERYMPRHNLVIKELGQLISQGLKGQELSDKAAPYFERFQKISIDFGIMERSMKIKVIPSDFGWNDIGSFTALNAIFKPDINGNVIKNSNIRQVDTSDNTIVTDGFTVGTIGVNNLIIVQSENKLLVCHKDRAQEIKKII